MVRVRQIGVLEKVIFAVLVLPGASDYDLRIVAHRGVTSEDLDLSAVGVAYDGLASDGVGRVVDLVVKGGPLVDDLTVSEEFYWHINGEMEPEIVIAAVTLVHVEASHESLMADTLSTVVVKIENE